MFSFFLRYDKNGFNKKGINKDTGTCFDKNGYDVFGYTKNGFDKYGINKNTKTFFDKEGYNRDGYNRDGYDIEGYNRDGYDIEGYDRGGYDIEGYKKNGFNVYGINKKTGSNYDECGYDKEGYNRDGYDKDGYDMEGYDKNGFDRNGIARYVGNDNGNSSKCIKIFFFDTETTGLSPKTDYIVQFGGIYGELNIKNWSFKELDRINQLINVPIKIPEVASNIHGIYNADLKGYDYIDKYIDSFLSFIKKADFVVGHNVDFDKGMLIGECSRLGIDFNGDGVQWIDTMKPCTDLVGIQRGGRNKRPKLIELYYFLFGKKFDGAHDAMIDITATKDCFIELCKNYNFYEKINEKYKFSDVIKYVKSHKNEYDDAPFPIDDILDCMINPKKTNEIYMGRLKGDSYCEKCGLKMFDFYFTSPPSTRQGLCGRSCDMRICPKCKKFIVSGNLVMS